MAKILTKSGKLAIQKSNMMKLLTSTCKLKLLVKHFKLGKSVQISTTAEMIYRIVNIYYFHNIIDASNNLSKGCLMLRKSSGIN